MASAAETQEWLAERPAVVAFVGDFDHAARVERLASAAGCTLQGVFDHGAAATPVPLPSSACAYLVLAGGSADPDRLAPLLTRLNRAAEEGGAVVADVSPPLIDLAAARLSARRTALLVDSSAAEIVAALAVAVHQPVPAGAQVSDPNGDRARELKRLSEDVERIARVLAALSSEREADSTARSSASTAEGAPLDRDAMLADLRLITRARRLRERYFAADLFSDPAWDMLLDLMAARLDRKPVAVSSLCIAAAVPPTTALRQLKAMVDAGLFLRRPDPADARRVFIELADEPADALARYLAARRSLMTARA